MRALIQRVSRAAVRIDGECRGEIGRGLVILLGVRTGDTAKEVEFVAEKCLNLRIFEDDQGKMNRSVLDVGGGVLVVFQFTLCGDTRKGRRPSFVEAAPPPEAVPLYDAFVERIRASATRTETGEFGAMMQIDLVNDGPVTLMIEKEADS